VSEEVIVQINYWKEMRRELNKTISQLRGVVLLTHNSVDFTDIIDFLNLVQKDEWLTTLYISLIQSYDYIKNKISVKPLKNKRLFFVDCVSHYVKDQPDNDNCIYKKIPYNLEEMKKLIEDSIKYVNPNLIIIDSLSQYINFTTPTDNELHELYKFLKSIKEDVLGITCYAVILIYDDKLGSMKKLPTLFTDLILKLEIIKEKIQWTD
jgi:hypothetical protein